jgi:non-specific protein-tyrosine kinase
MEEEMEREEFAAEEIDLRVYLQILQRWLWLIILCTLIAAISAYVISAKFMRPVYRAETTLMVQPSGGTSGTLQYQDVLLGERIAKTYAEIIKSKALQEKLLTKLGYPPELEKLPFNVSVQVVRDTQLIKIGVESEDPELAANAANTLAQIFIEDRTEKQAERFSNLRASIEAQIAQLEEDMRKIAEQKSVTHDQDLVRSLDQQLISLQDMRTRLLAQLYELRLTEARYADVITQVEKAEVPEKPVKPRKLLNTALAGILGAMVAVMAAFAAEYLDTSIKRPEQIEETTGLPVLGSIFEFEPNPGDSENPSIAMEHQRSPTAESFRVLRSNLEFISVDKPVQVLGVTSPGPEEGKTFVALNLGLAIAQGGKRVVLVDADLRRPKVHKILGFPQSPGLSEALIDKAYLKKFKNSNLAVLTAGRSAPNPADLLASQQMGKLIAKLKETADVIIVDTPPILSCADAVSLGKWVDGFLVVAEWGRTDRSAFAEAVNLARQSGLRVLGAVLNKVKPQSKGYYYHYYYYYDSSDKKPWWKRLFRRRKKRRVKKEAPSENPEE